MVPNSLISNIGMFACLDSDSESISHVQHNFGGVVSTTVGSIKDVLSPDSNDWGQFDFIYAAGLFDYLSDRLARRLTEAMFSKLLPGGKLWTANFLPSIPDVGYMESFMDWWLIYRDELAMRSLCNSLPDDSAVVKSFADPEQNVQFIEVTKSQS